MNNSIISEVCNISGCTYDQVKSRSRKSEIVRARQILVSYNHLVLFKTQEDSANDFNIKHSTVIHSIKSVQRDYQTNKNYRKLFGEFLESNKKMLAHKFHSYEIKNNEKTKTIF